MRAVIAQQTPGQQQWAFACGRLVEGLWPSAQTPKWCPPGRAPFGGLGGRPEALHQPSTSKRPLLLPWGLLGDDRPHIRIRDSAYLETPPAGHGLPCEAMFHLCSTLCSTPGTLCSSPGTLYSTPNTLCKTPSIWCGPYCGDVAGSPSLLYPKIPNPSVKTVPRDSAPLDTASVLSLQAMVRWLWGVDFRTAGQCSGPGRPLRAKKKTCPVQGGPPGPQLK